MITIKAEWTMKTEFGHTECTADKTVYGNYRDVESVENVVEWVKKVFNSKKYGAPCVDFLYDNGTAYGVTVTRYFRDWNGVVNKVVFEGKGEGEKSIMDKLTKKEIKEAYLHTAEMCAEYEEKESVS